jgi:hypothetical protein
MTTRLNQILAIEKGIKTESYADLTALKNVAEKPALFDGFDKDYERINDQDAELPGEQKKVQRTFVQVLRSARKAMTELMDITARKDWTNCVAKADVKIGETVLIPQVPATHLLFLEKQLTDLRSLTSQIPVLDPSEDWQANPNATGIHNSKATKTHRTKKVQRPIVKYDATDKHPAQTELITEYVLVGYWNLVRHSGAIPEPVREVMIERIDRVLQAVKQAREAANGIEEVSAPSVGDRIFDFVMDGTLPTQST